MCSLVATLGGLQRFCSLAEDSTCSEYLSAIHTDTCTSSYFRAGLKGVQKDLGSSDLLQAELRVWTKFRIGSLLLCCYQQKCLNQEERKVGSNKDIQIATKSLKPHLDLRPTGTAQLIST